MGTEKGVGVASGKLVDNLEQFLKTDFSRLLSNQLLSHLS
jgi:hypothetical protein